jgi:hypothetical protein
MYVLRKKVPGALTYQILLDIPKKGGYQYDSLEHWVEWTERGARLVSFPSVDEAAEYIASQPGLCGPDTLICGINFRVNGLSFYPVHRP